MVKTKVDKKRGEFSFKDQYIKSWNYLKESKNFVYAILVIFFVFAFIGFFVKTPDEISDKILNYFKDLIEMTSGYGFLRMSNFIFWNNLRSSFFSLFFGFLFGIFPFFVALLNGYVLGFVASLAVDQSGISSLLSLVPHGIFELPAVFISMGLGLRLGSFVLQKNKSESFRRYLWEGLRVFVFIVLPLLIIAALIEGFFISLK